MSTKIKATTKINVQTGPRQVSEMYNQRYQYLEEGSNNIERVVQPDSVEKLNVVPDVDIQSAIKFVMISADGEVTDLEASRVAMSIRTYDTPKSATASGDIISTYGDDKVVYGEMAASGERVEGDKSLAETISIKGGAVGLMLSKDSAGNPTNYPDENALPLVLSVDNKGTKAITVKVKALYDPTPAVHEGEM